MYQRSIQAHMRPLTMENVHTMAHSQNPCPRADPGSEESPSCRDDHEMFSALVQSEIPHLVLKVVIKKPDDFEDPSVRKSKPLCVLPANEA